MANRLSRQSIEVIGFFTPKGNYLSRQSIEILGILSIQTSPTFKIILI